MTASKSSLTTKTKPVEAVQATPASQPVPDPTPAPTPAVDTSTQATEPIVEASSGCGDNSYAQFIYTHESGCQLYNPNSSSGACGIGQAWPCSKLTNACPNLDYACENAFFTNYAVSRYGSWAGAYEYWIAHNWW